MAVGRVANEAILSCIWEVVLLARQLLESTGFLEAQGAQFGR